MTQSTFIAGDLRNSASHGSISGPAVQLVFPGTLWDRLQDHLFRSDGDEHAAVLAVGMVRSRRGVRLLVRDVVLAEDGADFVPGKRGFKRLSPAFVNEQIRTFRDAELGYVAVHNHAGRHTVAFSAVDLASHERGYPALLDIVRGQCVGAVVLAEAAVAGDIWMPDGQRHPVGETVVLGRNRDRFYPTPRAAPPGISEIDDRQARIYGAAGQSVLKNLKVGVIGAGGVGLPIVALLARLGITDFVVVDPQRVEVSNLPRLPESRRRHTLSSVVGDGSPGWLRRLARRASVRKVRLAKRVARRARPGVSVDAIFGDIADDSNARRLADCDYLFLAADSHVARAVFNALVHAFLIPGAQVGSHVAVSKEGDVGDISSVYRPVTPDGGCLWCNELIRASRLNDEMLTERERAAREYIPREDAPAPSVMSLNAVGVAQATNRFMLYATGMLLDTDATHDYRRFECRAELGRTELPRRDDDCTDCGHGQTSLRGRGHLARLPTVQK